VNAVMWRNILGQSVYQLAILNVLWFKGKELLHLPGPPGIPHVIDATGKGLPQGDAELVTIIFCTFVFMQIFNQVQCRHQAQPPLFHVAHMWNPRMRCSRKALSSETWESGARPCPCPVGCKQGGCCCVVCRGWWQLNSRKLEDWNVFSGVLKNRLFVAIFLLEMVIQFVVAQFLGMISGCVPLPAAQWGMCFLLGAGCVPLGMLTKLVPIPGHKPRQRRLRGWKNVFQGGAGQFERLDGAGA